MDKNHFDEIPKLKQDLLEFLHSQYDLRKLMAAEQLSRLFGKLMVTFILGFVSFLVFFFLSIAISLKFGDLLENYVVGFIIVGLFYLLMGLIMYWLRHRIFHRPIIQIMLNLFFPPQITDNHDKSED